MKRAAAVVVVLLVAHGAGAQCLGDFNGDMRVEVNELIIAVNNALTDCQGSGPTPTPTPTVGGCPIDFSSDNTAQGTPDCYYTGRWNQSCGAGDLEARWISNGSIVVVDFQGFTPGLFYGANVVSPTSAQLIGWYTQPDASDGVRNVPGDLTLSDGEGTLVVAPDTVPFQIDSCDFVRYQGTLSQVVQSGALRAKAPQQIDPSALEKLRAALAARPARRNFERQ